jgi:hypothetical protein
MMDQHTKPLLISFMDSFVKRFMVRILFQKTILIYPGPSTDYRSAQSYHGIKCFIKAAEAIVFPLDKGFLVICKPVMHVSFMEIAAVTFSRGSASTKSFEIKFNLTTGVEMSFSSLAR